MKTSITLQNASGKRVQVKMGFSYTTLLFSCLPDIISGNLKTATTFVLGLFLTTFIIITAFNSQGGDGLAFLVAIAIQIYYPAKRNQALIEYYFSKGFKVIDGTKSEVDGYLGWATTNEVWG